MVRKILAEKRALLKLTRDFTNISYRHLGKKYGVKSTAYDDCNANKKAECEKGKAGHPKAL